MTAIRVRFAPSPTGALHIGGVRTALYNYLLAKKTGGTFILRIEDTDQARYVEGAEKYIMESLKWCGMQPEEGPGIGGDFGPYRQSERKELGLYKQYAQQLVDNGYAYYAFDTAEDLARERTALEVEGKTFKYGVATRLKLVNSLTLSEEEVKIKIENGEDYTIRLKVPADEIVVVSDLIRGEVSFQSNVLDDKVMLKSDGMPTYHLANIVDDYLMKISHVIRGEEWLPSTAHHVLLYRYLGWETEMPQFAHLPLILKPTGKGKLSKRDGDKLGIPVFPLAWKGETPEDSFNGFREFGFMPEAVINFLAFLGWNPGTEQELFCLEALSEAFSLEKIGKSGARFDFEKAKWFNQQYISAASNERLMELVVPYLNEKGYSADQDFISSFLDMMKERVNFLNEFTEQGYYFFEQVKDYDDKTIRKKWKAEQRVKFETLQRQIHEIENYDAENIEKVIKGFINDSEFSFGEVFPILRIALSGTMKGPDLFSMIAMLGKEEVDNRLKIGFDYFDEVLQAV